MLGSSVPAKMPSPMLVNTTNSTASAPAKRPARYCALLMGAVKKKDSVRCSKSCCTARPDSAAMTVSPNMPRNATVWAIAYGELIQTLPLPKMMFALLIAPPAAAVHNIAMAKNAMKYTQVDSRLIRVRSSKPAMDRSVPMVRRSPLRPARAKARAAR